MRALLFLLLLVITCALGSCAEPEARDTRALEAYCESLDDPRIADPIGPAIAIAARARAHHGETTAHCDGLSETLSRAHSFAQGFGSSTHVAARASGEVLVSLSFEILPSQTEAEVACEHGDFDALDGNLEQMRAQAQTEIDRATRRCEELLGE